MDARASREQGLLSPLVLIVALLSLLVVGLAAFSIWSYTNYLDQKNNVDQKVAEAVSSARSAQSSADAAKFAEQAKLPTIQFVGPADLGSVKFNYPKTWSSYLGSGEGGGAYQVFFHPGTVPTINTGQSQFALRLSIINQNYESVLGGFQGQLTNGSLKASSVMAGGETGMRLDGAIEPNVDGVMVIMKIRDQTLELFTESRAFQQDFDKTIVPSLTFNR